MPETTDRELLLSFIASLSLCDHMGDVANKIADVLKRMGETPPSDATHDWYSDLRDWLHERGARTLNGTSLE